MPDSPTTKESPPLRLFIFLDRPWKLSLAATIVSGAATFFLTNLFFQPETASAIILPLVISTLVAAPSTYLIGRLFYTYHRLLQQRNQELMVVNEELNAFAHTVAHDLKTPLFTLSGYLETLLVLLPTMEMAEIEQTLKPMLRSSQTMHQIITDLLLLAETRQENIPMKPLDMAHIMNQSQERLRDMIAESQAVLTIQNEWPTAIGYAPWVEAVWVNYLSNGMKYGGAPPHLHLGARVEGDGQVKFWVQDNGPGIDPQDHARLFSEFTRLEQGRGRARGSGLGLSIVQRIVTRMGGRVGVESQVGQGSCFYFTLPT
ncbi:MAG: HAMP domain-containing histidine kinase [Anaerolineae bacterium]|nr:HAMP domain-containing histidine kinase [Anaerolineae bacterium]